MWIYILSFREINKTYNFKQSRSLKGLKSETVF